MGRVYSAKPGISMNLIGMEVKKYNPSEIILPILQKEKYWNMNYPPYRVELGYLLTKFCRDGYDLDSIYLYKCNEDKDLYLLYEYLKKYHKEKGDDVIVSLSGTPRRAGKVAFYGYRIATLYPEFHYIESDGKADSIVSLVVKDKPEEYTMDEKYPEDFYLGTREPGIDVKTDILEKIRKAYFLKKPGKSLETKEKTEEWGKFWEKYKERLYYFVGKILLEHKNEKEYTREKLMEEIIPYIKEEVNDDFLIQQLKKGGSLCSSFGGKISNILKDFDKGGFIEFSTKEGTINIKRWDYPILGVTYVPLEAISGVYEMLDLEKKLEEKEKKSLEKLVFENMNFISAKRFLPEVIKDIDEDLAKVINFYWNIKPKISPIDIPKKIEEKMMENTLLKMKPLLEDLKYIFEKIKELDSNALENGKFYKIGIKKEKIELSESSLKRLENLGLIFYEKNELHLSTKGFILGTIIEKYFKNLESLK
jgi:hypothetical protein